MVELASQKECDLNPSPFISEKAGLIEMKQRITNKDTSDKAQR